MDQKYWWGPVTFAIVLLSIFWNYHDLPVDAFVTVLTACIGSITEALPPGLERDTQL